MAFPIIAERTCYTCKITKPISEFQSNRAEKSGHDYECKACKARRYAHTKGRKRRACQECGREFDPTYGTQRFCSKACYHDSVRHREKPETMACNRCGTVYPYTREFFGVNSHASSAFKLHRICKPCIALKARSVNLVERTKLRVEVLTHYGNGFLTCVCCGENHFEFLTLDHVNGKGKEDRKKYPATMLPRRLRRLGFPPGYRTLCYNCNCSLGVNGYCPHQNSS